MKKYRKQCIAAAVVLAVVVLIMTVTDVFFRGYEKEAFIKEVDRNAPVYDLKDFSFNDHGGPLSRDGEPGEFRILSIGDSYAAAITKPEYSYSAVLEKDLNELGIGKRFRVINLGVGGTSFPQYMGDYLFWSKILRCDAVLFNVYLGNDFTDVEHKPFDPRAARREKFITGIGATLPHEYPFRFMDYVFGIIKARSNLKPGDAFYNPSYQLAWEHYVLTMVKSARIFNPAELPGFVNSVDWAGRFMAYVKQIQDAGIPVAVIASPPHLFFDARLLQETAASAGVSPEDYDPALPVFLLNELGKRAGVAQPVLDPRACLSQHAAEGENLYYGTDTHWNVAGNRVVGDYLARMLAERWLGVTPSSPLSDCQAVAAPPSPGEKARTAVLGMLK